MISFILLFAFLLYVKSLRICVVGGSSSLGREIIYQCICDYNIKVIGITDSPQKVCIPYRGSGLDDKSDKLNRIVDSKLKLISYSDPIPKYYDAIIFSIGGTAFEKSDYSDEITKKYLDKISNQCKSVILISAYGVGNSIKNANIGIVSMRNWYLKDVYRAKEIQEKLVENITLLGVKKTIYRPKVLSYGDTSFESIPRQKLAKEIIENILSR